MDSKIRFAKDGEGPNDGVELEAKCAITRFTGENGKPESIESMAIEQCKILASYELGTVSVSVHKDRPFMVSVRLDELMALLWAAADRKNNSEDR